MSGLVPEWLGEGLVIPHLPHSRAGGSSQLLPQAGWTLTEVEEGRGLVILPLPIRDLHTK